MNVELKKQFAVTSADVDFSLKLKVSSFLNMFIQSAWQHAGQLGFGFKKLEDQNLSWVLSRITMEFNELPQWADSVEITTWPKGFNRLFYVRDAVAVNGNNQPVAKITGDWLIIDKQTRRPKLYDKDNPILHKQQYKHAIKVPTPVINFDFNIFKSRVHTITYSDIDLNQHLTATRYIDLAFDMFALEELKNRCIEKLTVNFVKEAVFNETVIMKRYCHNLSNVFELISQKNGTPLFRATIEFKN